MSHIIIFEADHGYITKEREDDMAKLSEFLDIPCKYVSIRLCASRADRRITMYLHSILFTFLLKVGIQGQKLSLCSCSFSRAFEGANVLSLQSSQIYKAEQPVDPNGRKGVEDRWTRTNVH